MRPFRFRTLSMSAALASGCLALAAASSQAAGAVEAPLDAGTVSCMQLEAQIEAAGSLVVIARRASAYGEERMHRNTFVRDLFQCDADSEARVQWTIYAKDGEICERTYICVPFFTHGGAGD